MEVLDFYADWCGPCQMMKPVMADFEKSHPDVKVTAVNIDEKAELAQEYGVSGIPCIVFLKDGEEVDRVVGVAPLKKLENILEK